MKISVIIPVYNVERYLARCLDSVLAAAARLATAGHAAEIICVNDGSTDGSRTALAQYADRVKIVDKSNGGLGSARNAGLDVMTGDYVTFVDSDDYIPDHALVRFAEVAVASKAALVVSTSFLKDDGRPSLQPSAAGLQPSSSWQLRRADWIAGRKVQYCAWNKLYQRELFATRRYPATLFEDLPVTTAVLCEAGSFAAVEEPLYVYCTNAGANSIVRSAFTARKLADSLTVVRLTLETARLQSDPRLARFALRQAANGHSSTVGQVWKAKDPELRAAFLSAHKKLVAEFPELKGKLSLKASLRLWLMKHA